MHAADQRREAALLRMQVISEMNHHIRNALQVITYASAAQNQNDSVDSVDMIRSSVERIEWALREVLPGHVTSPAASPTPARHESLRTG